MRLLRPCQVGFNFWCPGCYQMHTIYVNEANASGFKWQFDGKLESPTFSPSIRIPKIKSIGGIREEIGTQCHVSIAAGMLKFEPDCQHALAGLWVQMEPV